MVLGQDGSGEEIELQIVHLLSIQQAQQHGGLVLLSVGKHQFLDDNFLALLTIVPDDIEKDIFRDSHQLTLENEHLQHIEKMMLHSTFLQLWVEITPHPLLLCTLQTELDHPTDAEEDDPAVQAGDQSCDGHLHC